MKEKKKKRTGSRLPNTESQSQQRKRVKLQRMAELPDEIIDDILSRLPIKSLLRFKSVCKRWLSLISNPDFHPKVEFESFLIVGESNSETLTASIYSIDDSKAVTKSSSSIMCNERKKPGQETIISNSCNGLVIIGFGNSFFVFNPSTHYFAKVLSCPHGYEYVTVGLCYDASIDDYKVVVWLSPTQTHCCKTKPVVAATLKSKRWVPVGLPFGIDSVKEGPIVNERMHCTVEERIDNYNRNKSLIFRSKKIVRYDPCANLFEEFPSPIGNGNAVFCLGVLGESLSMARWVDKGKFTKERIEVLTMKEYGVRESWTTLFFLSSDFRPFLFTKNCEVFLKKKPFSNSSMFHFTKKSKILKKESLTELLAYNLRKGTTTDLGLLSHRNWWDAVSFVQNFDSPVGCEWDEMLHKEHGRRIEWQPTVFAPRQIHLAFN